jgi:hypothetical protein
MGEDILKAAGITCRTTRHTRPPSGTYGVIMDDVEADGADGVVLFYRHETTLELYEPQPDPEAEERLEAELDARGLMWSKQDRYWLEDRQRYQVVYEFSYITKKRR